MSFRVAGRTSVRPACPGGSQRESAWRPSQSLGPQLASPSRTSELASRLSPLAFRISALVVDLHNRDRIELFKKHAGLAWREPRVMRLEAKEELVCRRAIAEVRRIEERMIKLRKTIQRDHSESRRETCEQDRPLIARDHKGRPAEQRHRANVQRIPPYVHPHLHAVARNQPHDSADQAYQRNACLVEAQRFGCLLHGIRRIALHAAIPRTVRHLGRVHQLRRSVELRQQTIDSFTRWHQRASSTTRSAGCPPGRTLVCGSIIRISLIGIIGASRAKSRNRTVKKPHVPINSM